MAVGGSQRESSKVERLATFTSTMTRSNASGVQLQLFRLALGSLHVSYTYPGISFASIPDLGQVGQVLYGHSSCLYGTTKRQEGDRCM